MRQEHAQCSNCPQPSEATTVVALDLPGHRAPVRLCVPCLLQGMKAIATDKPFIAISVPDHVDQAEATKAILTGTFLTTAPLVGGGEALVKLIVEVIEEIDEAAEREGGADDITQAVH